MSSFANNLSLYTIKACLILDNEGKRLLAKYYRPSKGEYPTVKEQKAFEQTLFDKTRRSTGEIILLQGQVICYRNLADVIVYVVGSADENELILASALGAFVDAVSILVRHQVDKRAIQDNYDLVALALDETIDDGIILEVDADQIVSRVSKRGQDTVTLESALNEQSLTQAWGMAKERFAQSILR